MRALRQALGVALSLTLAPSCASGERPAPGSPLPGPVLPSLRVEPTEAQPGAVISVRSAAVLGDGPVTVGGRPADVLARSDSHVVLRVPSGARPGAAEVRAGSASGRLVVDPAAPAPLLPTFVSLSFDDTYASHSAVATALQARDMRGTFFVNSVRLDHPGYLATADVREMEAAGHEIGGHTLHHLWLPLLSPDEKQRQICDDRARLVGLGLRVRSFAFPGGYADAETKRLVAGCGYRSARLVGGGVAETIPPSDPFAMRISDTMRAVVSLEQLESWVARHEGSGGWVHVVFHDVCDGCSSSAIPPARFGAFLDWLASRRARGTFVRTIAEMTGGTLAPAVAGAPVTAAPAASDRAPNGSFEETLAEGGALRCWQAGDPGEKAVAWSRVEGAAHGAFAMRLEGSRTAGTPSRRLRTFRDAGACAVPVAPRERLRIAARVKGASRVALSVSRRDAGGFWGGWADGPPLPSGAEWAEIAWELPPAPAGASALAIGLVALDASELLVDDVRVTRVDAP